MFHLCEFCFYLKERLSCGGLNSIRSWDCQVSQQFRETMISKGVATRTVTLFIIAGWMLHSSSTDGAAIDSDVRWNRILPFLKNRARQQWHSVRDDLVKVMSVQGSKVPPTPVFPDLPTLAGQLGLNSLVADVVKAGLTKDLSARGPMTVLGPNDVAFSTVPDWLKKEMGNTTTLAGILKFHILKDRILLADMKNELLTSTLQGPKVRFNLYPNNVTTAQCAVIDEVNVNKMASNGVLQELKQVMVPPVGDLAKAVSLCPVFTTLAKAVDTAELTKLLQEAGPFTLFAPTDAAFKKLNPQTLNSLINNKTALTDLLEYHVTQNTYCSAGLVSYGHLDMLNGEQVNITLDAETVRVNNAAIIPSGVDGSVSNGVMHAIDSVLIPPSLRPLFPPSPPLHRAKSP